MVADLAHEVWNSSADGSVREPISTADFFWIPDIEILGLMKVTTQKVTTPNGGFLIKNSKVVKLSQK